MFKHAVGALVFIALSSCTKALPNVESKELKEEGFSSSSLANSLLDNDIFHKPHEIDKGKIDSNTNFPLLIPSDPSLSFSLGLDHAIKPNNPPKIVREIYLLQPATNSDEVSEQMTGMLIVEAHDVDGDILTYQWFIDGQEVKQGKGEDANKYLYTGKAFIEHNVKVVVSDTRGGTVTQESKFVLSPFSIPTTRFTSKETKEKPTFYESESYYSDNGGGTLGHILKVVSDISGDMFYISPQKRDGTAFQPQDGILYLKSGTYEDYGVNLKTLSLMPGHEVNTIFSINLNDYESGRWPKYFYVRLENANGFAWAGPIIVRRSSSLIQH